MENEEYVDETVDDDDEVSDEYIQNMIRENKKKFRNKNLNDLKILYEHNLETYNKHPHDESTNAFFLYFLKCEKRTLLCNSQQNYRPNNPL